MRKKKVLFIMGNLRCGGAEKALISLLQTMDFSRYSVDIFLFKHEGLFLNQIPKEVRLLPEVPDYRFFDMPFKEAVLKGVKSGKFGLVLNRLLFSILNSFERNQARFEQKSWKFVRKAFPRISEKYDVSIGFLEKAPTYFCVDRTTADIKIGYIHNDYDSLKMLYHIDRRYFRKLRHVVTVSDECVDVLHKRFPEFSSKFKVVPNIISSRMIRNLAQEKDEILTAPIKLVTVGRLVHQKGYDIAIAAAAELVAKGIDNFKWYILGVGPELNSLQKQIEELNVSDYFEFLGIRENPYAIMAQADIYVQPSRFEGYGITVTEAKILRRPMVLTRFNTAELHISHTENGLIADMNPASVAQTVIELMTDSEMRVRFQNNLAIEEFGTEASIEQFEELLENEIGR